MLSHHNVVMT